MDTSPPGGTAPEPEGALTGRPWLRRRRPFPHVLGHDVFVPEVYDRFAAAFERAMTTAGDGGSGFRFRPAHDLHSLAFGPATVGPLSLFVSRSWHDLVARVAGVTATGDVNGGLHHHPVGSHGGRTHNDLSPGWFPRPSPGAVQVSDESVCDYRNGHTTDPARTVAETVRAVAVIYFLNNPRWRPGDGGETGLYRTGSDPRPAVVVPPVNNSLLMFRCTPYSFHRFLGNERSVRNSVIMWLHEEREPAYARWRGRIVRWPTT